MSSRRVSAVANAEENILFIKINFMKYFHRVSLLLVNVSDGLKRIVEFPTETK